MALLLVLAGCGGFGRVNQGQVVDYQRSTGMVTLVADSNYGDPANPRFDALPPVVIHVPDDPAEMGAEPEAGKLLALDISGQRAVIFDAASQTIRTVPIVVVSEQAAPPSARKYPVVDHARKTVAAWLPRHRRVVVFSVPDEFLALPADTWKTGDEIRYYYKDPARALRLMNVSKVDLNKAGE